MRTLPADATATVDGNYLTRDIARVPDQVKNAIRDVLGHSSSATTWRYARIDMEMKRKTIEACTPEDSRPSVAVPAWRRDGDLLAQLEAIGHAFANGESTGKSSEGAMGCQADST